MVINDVVGTMDSRGPKSAEPLTGSALWNIMETIYFQKEPYYVASWSLRTSHQSETGQRAF
jgi:hypothetical protein